MMQVPLMNLFLFDFNGQVRIVRATIAETAIDEIQKVYNLDRTMLRNNMRSLPTIEISSLDITDKITHASILYDQNSYYAAKKCD